MKKFLYILTFLFCFNNFGQEPYTINYTINDGLPTNTIYDAHQDKEGFIWFATDVGVIKYNSKDFVLFSSDDGLTDNEVFKIREDFKGRKWLLTLNGTPSYIKNDTIYNSENSTIIQKIESKNMLIDFYEDKDNNIYLISRNGNLTEISTDNTVNSIENIKINTSGIWKIGDELAILNSSGIYNPISKKLTKIDIGKVPYRVFHHKKEVFFNNFNRLYKVNSSGMFKQIITLPNDFEIINIYKESSSKIWICTRKGVFLVENKKIVKHFFKEKTVTSISKDIEGNYWLTTLQDGIFLIPSFSILQRDIAINTIANNDNNEIWFGGMENDYYIKKNNTFTKKTFNKNWRKDEISKIRFFTETTYIIGKVGLKKITKNYEIEIPINLNDILEQGDSLFLATAYLSKISKNELDQKEYDKIYHNRFLNRRIYTIKNVNSSIYLGTNIGLYCYKNNALIFLGDKFPELKSSINQIFYDDESNLLLVATSSKGLIILDNDVVKFSISKKDRLNNNTITTIKKTATATYLVGSNKGINSITLSGSNFTIKDFNTFLAFKNKKINDFSLVNDTLYIATNDQLIYFHKNYFTKKNTPPIVSFKSIYANNKKINFSLNKTIKYTDNNLKFEYDGISFLDEGNLNFFYKLNNTDWSSTEERTVNYKNLKAGNYNFALYAVNGFGHKSEVKKISFTIATPFWQTWWFLLLLILGIGLAIYYFLKLRLNYLQKQFLKEKKSILLEKENIALENQMLALEQKALRLQMNPHFIFNALNTIKGYYSEGNVQEASNYISNFSKLLRLLLENVEQYIPLSLEVEMLGLYLQLTQVRYQHKFDYQIIIDKNLNAKETSIPTLLLQPIIENAVIHGVSPKSSKGKIIVSFHKKENSLICIVNDDGIGRKASQKNKKTRHTSKAISITKERLALIEIQEITKCNLQFIDLMEDKKSTGTQVIITIPLLKIW
ncbi:sensor histidine kinase [Polaribacter porphyrae]|uniref:Signal transduction histidine kinase internal region domain-containing protein n=1 Tax=Polaribacter porphyrae TaxID=1137780 RepID=A0A2S7WLR7_9FLAO|nr:histidine kinase [Polaribacter porphyrae]PQJ78548.1 hypothetical protein BTO18_04815 [Polaribacter porphyrae]